MKRRTFLILMVLIIKFSVLFSTEICSLELERDKIFRKESAKKSKLETKALAPVLTIKDISSNVSLYEEDNYFLDVKLESMTSNEISVIPCGNIVNSVSFSDFALGNFNLIVKNNETITFESKDNVLNFVINGNSYVSREVIFAGNVKIISGKKQKEYTGFLKLNTLDSKVILYNKVEIEKYLEGVLEKEFPSNVDLDSIIAQAIAIRTYAYKKSLSESLELCDTTHCQVFNGVSFKPQITEAVKMTKGVILTYNREVISVMYSADAGGATEDWAEVNNGNTTFPYLTKVVDPFEIKHIEWNYSIKKNSLLKYLGIKKDISDIYVSFVSSTGRVQKIGFVDKETKKITLVNGDKLRNILGVNNIKSTLFNIIKKDDLVIFTGKGYGHGFGLCQKTCIEMGKNDYSYEQILDHFFPNTEFANIYDSEIVMAKK